MNPNAIIKFLQSLRRLAESGVVKSADEAMDFAKREFGEVSDLLKRQIEQVFRKPQGGITSIKKPKEGEVIEAVFKPGVDKRGKRVEESPSQASGIMQRLEKQKDDLFNMLKNNPYRSGGPLDPKMGLVRTAARQVLQKLAREGKINIADEREAKAIIEGYQGGVDPIEVFKKTFGQDTLNDLSSLGDELIEIENRGGSFTEITKILDDEGFFDLKQPKNPPQGMTDDELEKMLRDDKEEKILKDFDPEDRDPNAMGGIMRANYKIGSGIRLAKFLASKGKDLKEEIKKAVDNIFESGDSKYDADAALDSMLEELGVDRELFDQKDIINAYGEAYGMITKKRGLGGKVPGGQTPGSKPIKQGDEITSENFGDSQFAPDTSELERARELTPKMVERLELKQKYPGIDDDLLDNIIADPDPQHKAQVLATLDQTFKLMETGKGPDEIIDILEQGKKTRKDNAEGGLNYLMGM
jgi:hypothetical protein